MRALEKDRGRRYETASGAGAGRRAVPGRRAGRGVAAERTLPLRKFLRRHKGPAIAASLLLAALVAGVVGTGIGLRREKRAAKQLAERRLGQVENANEILGSVFDDLDPYSRGAGR